MVVIYSRAYRFELWIVIGLFALPGIYFVQAALRALPDSFRLLSMAGFLHRLALVLLILVILVGALGVSLLLTAWLLYKADRVGRGLAYVVIASLTALALFGDNTSGGEVLSMLAGIAAAAVLALSPAVRDVFTAANAPTHAQPTSVIVARVALAIWIGLLGLAGILYLLISDINGKYAVIGLLLLGLAGGAFALYRRLTTPDRSARLIATAGAGAAICAPARRHPLRRVHDADRAHRRYPVVPLAAERRAGLLRRPAAASRYHRQVT